MIRRALAIAILTVPAVGFSISQGCATEPLPQDVCSWLGDNNNCYVRFATDVFNHCGYDPPAEPSDPVASATGYFAALDDLSICIVDGGGQVIFDPPLDTSTFPLTSTTFTILDKKAVECGKGTFDGERSYSITINPVDQDDAGTAVGEDGCPLNDDIAGGTFSIARVEGRERVDVSCPGGVETHNFNLLQLQNCTDSEEFMPRAVLETNRGVPQTDTEAGVNGYIRLRIYYPVLDNGSGSGGSGTGGTGAGGLDCSNTSSDPVAVDADTPLTTRVVEYFNCSIPAPPAPCSNMVLDGNETDIDCGGSCPTKCGEGQNCDSTNDCDTTLGLSCGFVGGIQQCVAS